MELIKLKGVCKEKNNTVYLLVGDKAFREIQETDTKMQRLSEAQNSTKYESAFRNECTCLNSVNISAFALTEYLVSGSGYINPKLGELYKATESKIPEKIEAAFEGTLEHRYAYDFITLNLDSESTIIGRTYRYRSCLGICMGGRDFDEDYKNDCNVVSSISIEDRGLTDNLIAIIHSEYAKLSIEMLAESIEKSLDENGDLSGILYEGLVCVTNDIETVCSQYVNRKTLGCGFSRVEYGKITAKKGTLDSSYSKQERSKLDVWKRARNNYTKIEQRLKQGKEISKSIYQLEFDLPDIGSIEDIPRDWFDDDNEALIDYIALALDRDFGRLEDGKQVNSFAGDKTTSKQEFKINYELEDKYQSFLLRYKTESAREMLKAKGLTDSSLLPKVVELMKFSFEDPTDEKDIRKLAYEISNAPILDMKERRTLALFQITVGKDTFYLITESSLGGLLKSLTNCQLGIRSETIFLNMSSIDVIKKIDSIELSTEDDLYREYKEQTKYDKFFLFEASN